jgi:hypothetical protein
MSDSPSFEEFLIFIFGLKSDFLTSQISYFEDIHSKETDIIPKYASNSFQFLCLDEFVHFSVDKTTFLLRIWFLKIEYRSIEIKEFFLTAIPGLRDTDVIKSTIFLSSSKDSTE